VRALVETGALIGERGVYRLARPVEHLTMPTTVQAILAARIDRLTPEVKRLLQTAAVVGKDVPMPLLLAIADAPEHEVRAELIHLQAAEFLYEARLFPDLEYTFKHALTHEVAYQGQLHERQRALHARITEAIERLWPERVAEQAERLAHHALRGELWEKAVAHLRRAGLRAMARGANREAITHLEQALGAVRHLPEGREATELIIDIHLDLRNALIPLEEWARIGEHLHEAEGLARTLGDPLRLGRIVTSMANQCLVRDDYDEAVRFGQEALSIARTLGDRSIEVVATSYLGMTHAARGSSARRPPSSNATSRSRMSCATSALGPPRSSRRSQEPASLTYSPSSAGSTRQLATPRPPFRSLRRPIILSHCRRGCSFLVSRTSVAGTSPVRRGSSSGASTSAEGGRSSPGRSTPLRCSASHAPSPAAVTTRSRWSRTPSRSSEVASRGSSFCARG
jgi:tetratricopeptide (TPR) repeat protein